MEVSLGHFLANAKLAEVTAMLDDVKNGSQQVISRAINKVATAARTQIVRRIVQEVNLKAGEVRDRNVSLTKANYSRLEAMIRVSGRRIPLLRWGARQTAKGVSYAIHRGQRTLAPGLFMESHGTPIVMPSGHRGVFARSGPYVRMMRGRYVGKMRQQIFEKAGPSVPAVMGDIAELSAETLDEQFAAKLEGEIDSQIGLALARRGIGK